MVDAIGINLRKALCECDITFTAYHEELYFMSFDISYWKSETLIVTSWNSDERSSDMLVNDVWCLYDCT